MASKKWFTYYQVSIVILTCIVESCLSHVESYGCNELGSVANRNYFCTHCSLY